MGEAADREGMNADPADEIDYRADMSQDQHKLLETLAEANIEKATKVLSEYALEINPLDALRHRVERLIDYMLGASTVARFEFEQAWQSWMADSLENMHNQGVQYLKKLKEGAAIDPDAARQLMALQMHRKQHGVEGDVTGLVTPRQGLVIPGQFGKKG